jgi:hypothetical protein
MLNEAPASVMIPSTSVFRTYETRAALLTVQGYIISFLESQLKRNPLFDHFCTFDFTEIPQNVKTTEHLLCLTIFLYFFFLNIFSSSSLGRHRGNIEAFCFFFFFFFFFCQNDFSTLIKCPLSVFFFFF